MAQFPKFKQQEFQAYLLAAGYAYSTANQYRKACASIIEHLPDETREPTTNELHRASQQREGYAQFVGTSWPIFASWWNSQNPPFQLPVKFPSYRTPWEFKTKLDKEKFWWGWFVLARVVDDQVPQPRKINAEMWHQVRFSHVTEAPLALRHEGIKDKVYAQIEFPTRKRRRLYMRVPTLRAFVGLIKIYHPEWDTMPFPHSSYPEDKPIIPVTAGGDSPLPVKQIRRLMTEALERNPDEPSY